MMRAALFSACVLTIGAGWPRVAKAQPFTLEPSEFETGLLEPLQRVENNYTGFVFDFNTARVRLDIRDVSQG